MSLTTNKSLLTQAIQRRDVDLVGINEVKFLEFRRSASGKILSLGVRGLSACLVIIVASDKAAIVAHVGPNTLDSKHQDSFLRLDHSKIDELKTKYREQADFFSDSSQPYVVYATFQQEQTSPEQVKIFRERLDGLGQRIFKESSYERPQVLLIDDNRAEGTVWVVRPNPNRPSVVYLEDKIVSPTNAGETEGAGSSNSQSRYVQAGGMRVGHIPTTVAGQNPARSERPNTAYWTVTQGEQTYTLVDQDGDVLRRVETPPENVAIRMYSLQRTMVGICMWDGRQWKHL